VHFNPIYDRIGYLHEIFGPKYVRTLVHSVVRSIVKQVTGRYAKEEIYSTKNDEVEKDITAETRKVLLENNINMGDMIVTLNN